MKLPPIPPQPAPPAPEPAPAAPPASVPAPVAAQAPPVPVDPSAVLAAYGDRLGKLEGKVFPAAPTAPPASNEDGWLSRNGWL